jgi:hypothetical protein
VAAQHYFGDSGAVFGRGIFINCDARLTSLVVQYAAIGIFASFPFLYDPHLQIGHFFFMSLFNALS